MSTTISGGLSVQGSYHEKNQDSYWDGAVHGGWLVVLSDGLGSCKYSEIGSSTLCTTVRKHADAATCKIDNPLEFTKIIEDDWKKSVGEQAYSVEDCYATALFAIVGEEMTWFFRLGDGVLGAVVDSQPIVMCDSKEDSYCNVTDCVGTERPAVWETRKIMTRDLECVFICTDGVSDDTDKANLAELVMGFYEEYKGMAKDEIESDLACWVPALKSRDDKTVAFLFA